LKAPKIDQKTNLDWQTIDQKRSIIMPKLGESLKAGDEGGLKKHPLLIRNKVLMDEVEREVDKVRGKGFWKNLPK
ncbi:MAG: hypothetical protein ACREKR_15105, partial [Candidatus Methylomirabilales bacterium]